MNTRIQSYPYWLLFLLLALPCPAAAQEQDYLLSLGPLSYELPVENRIQSAARIGERTIVVWEDSRTGIAGIYSNTHAAVRALPQHVEPAPAEPKARVYPNPAIDHIVVTFSLPFQSTVEILLYNSQGQLVRSRQLGEFHTGENSAALNVSGLPVGYHTLVIQSDFGREIHPLIIGVSE